MKTINNTLELIKPSYDYIEDVFHYSSDEGFNKYLTATSHKTFQDSRDFIEMMIQRDQEECNMVWFIKEKNDDKVIGTLGLLNIDDNSAELAFGMSLQYKGRGYINSLVFFICEYVFFTLKKEILYGGTNILNKPVINTLKLLGFTEDTLKSTDKSWMYKMSISDFTQLNKISNELTSSIDQDRLLFEISNIIDENVTLDSTMENTLNWDSLNHINIIEMVSQKYNIQFKPQDIIFATSIKDILQLLEKMKNE
jgi:RimJ/RimL family protein N-acetyltransferase/acyl carrier protein